MATFNEILAGRFNRFAQKHFSMKGREGMPTLAADLQMGMQFLSGAENRYLEGWDLFGTGLQRATPGVGNQNVFRIRNPVGSGVAAVITRFAIADPTAAAIATGIVNSLLVQIGGTQLDENNTFNGSPWDARTQRTNSSVICSANSAAPAAFGAGVTIAICANAGSILQEYVPPGAELPLMPNTTYRVAANTSNTALATLVWWRERSLEDSEKA